MEESSPESPPISEGLFEDGKLEELVESLLHENTVYAIGVGGCGCNTVQHLHNRDMKNVKTIGINTDKEVLDSIDVDRGMLIGEEITDGEGAKGDPNLGKRSAEMYEEPILNTIEEADLVVIVAGMGGGTGSGASYVIADLARRNDKMVVSYAVMPFSSEGRQEKAQEALDELAKVSHTTTIFENDRLLNMSTDRSLSESFELTGKMLCEVVEKLKMEFITEFLSEIDMDTLGIEENISHLVEEEGEEKIEEPPVLKALKYLEEDEPRNPTLDSFLENYPR